MGGSNIDEINSVITDKKTEEVEIEGSKNGDNEEEDEKIDKNLLEGIPNT